MKVLLPHDVREAAHRRIGWLYDEFEHVLVNTSGGKDSTVILELAVEVATEKGRLPVEAWFIDQEAEWTSTIEIMREYAQRDDVNLRWFQGPLQLFNAASTDDPWLWCWREGDEWLRDKEPDSIHDNPYGTTRMTKLFTAFDKFHHPDEPVARLNGVRCEESPARQMGLTSYMTYKHVTWGSAIDKKRGHYTFSPIYDWTYRDVWKAIHDGGWSYNTHYDLQYQHGIATRNMRVSNLHHETALRSLHYAQEADADLWDRMTKRLSGLNAVKHMKHGFHQPPRDLPPMFEDWREYRDYLAENLIEDPEIRAKFQHQFEQEDGRFLPEIHEKLWKMHIASLLVNDWHGTKSSSFVASNGRFLRGAGSRTKKEEVPT